MTRPSLAIGVVLCAITLPVMARQATFSTKRESVRVDVLVSDRGRPVRGLTAADFELLDSGVPQQVDFVSAEQLPVNVVLALDGSASISPERLDHLRNGGRAVLDNLRPDDQAALLTFTDAVTLRERLTGDAPRVRTALDRMHLSERRFDGTALIDACYTGMTILEADVGRGLLIAFTDGVDTSSWLPPDRVLQAARRSNVVVYAVSTGSLRKGSFLKELSDVTGGDAIEIRSTDTLRATFVGILEEFRQRYLVSFSPADVPASGWHPLLVRVKNHRGDVKARPGYSR